MKENKGKIILITGGARSGKSTLAQKMAIERGEKVLFCATAQALDEEMKTRIEAHKKSRPSGWGILEAPVNTAQQLEGAVKQYDLVLIDCITLLVANSIGEATNAEAAEERSHHEIAALIKLMIPREHSYILVTNEVGFGIVPDNKLARLYRDALGRANQQLAACADEVYLLTAGLPLKLK